MERKGRPQADAGPGTRTRKSSPANTTAPAAGEAERVDPRVVSTRNQVFAATLEVIAEGGLAKATVEQIAERSGVARSTIYRNWPSLSLLYCEAFAHTARRPSTMPRGDTRRELLLYLLDYADRLSEYKYCSVLVALIDGSWRDPELARIRERLFDERTSRVSAILEAGIAAGNVAPDCDIRAAAEAILAPFLYRRLIDHRTITNEEILDLHRDLINNLKIGSSVPAEHVA